MKFSTDKLKVQLKIVKPRIELVHKKKISLNIRSKNEIADLLEKGKINTARIKVVINFKFLYDKVSRKKKIFFLYIY